MRSHHPDARGELWRGAQAVEWKKHSTIESICFMSIFKATRIGSAPHDHPGSARPNVVRAQNSQDP
ncbi:MAG: hypothetical protein NVS3B20_08520 [Polyangiales bacterium]